MVQLNEKQEERYPMSLKLPFDATKPIVGEASVEINRPPETVFNFIADNLLENYLPEGNQYKNTNWELREFLALSFLHRAPTKLHQLLDRNTEFFRIDTLDLYCSFDNMIESMFCYLNLTIDSTRISSWTNIYNEWKKIHEKSVKWDLNFDKIVEAIVSGKDIELTYYDLDIMQEAAIMQELMTKYNLTIKGYGLEKFPKNTKELHLLLETNFHYEIIRV
jgi:hypothetical protein